MSWLKLTKANGKPIHVMVHSLCVVSDVSGQDLNHNSVLMTDTYKIEVAESTEDILQRIQFVQDSLSDEYDLEDVQ